MENEEPDRLYIRESDRKDYDALMGRGSPLKGVDNKVVFMMAMTLGFHERNKMKLHKNRFGYVRTEYLSPKEKTIIKAIAVKDAGDLNVLLDKKKVFSIAEEYAAGGIKLLKDTVLGESYGSYIKNLESELVEIYKEKIAKAKVKK